MKITQQQLNNVLALWHRNSLDRTITDNDSYNIANLGLTKEFYYKIAKALNDIYGYSGYRPMLREVNNYLKNK